jgi:hypothetical protein
MKNATLENVIASTFGVLVLIGLIIVVTYMDTISLRVNYNYYRYSILNWKGKSLIGMLITTLYIYCLTIGMDKTFGGGFIMAVLIALFISVVVTDFVTSKDDERGCWEDHKDKQAMMREEYEEALKEKKNPKKYKGTYCCVCKGYH